MSTTIAREMRADEAASYMRDLVPGFMSERGVTGLAANDGRDRCSLEVDVALGLAGAKSDVLGVRPSRTVSKILLMTLSPYFGSVVRAALRTAPQVDVYLLDQWEPSDHDFWDGMTRLVSETSAEVVILDSVSHLSYAGTAAQPSVVSELERLGLPVLAMYAGNAKEPGVGGESNWTACTRKHWLSPSGDLHTLGRGEAAVRPVTLPRFEDLGAPPMITAELVNYFGQLMRYSSKQGGVDALASTLLTDHLPAVIGAVGYEPAQALVARALSEHQTAWRNGVAGMPTAWSPPDYDGPPPF